MRLERKRRAGAAGRTLLLSAVSGLALLTAAPALADEFTPVGDLPGGAFVSHMHGVSGDGGTAVGYSDTQTHIEAAIWTASGGIIALGDLPGGIAFSEATGVSGDGSVVVGFGSGASGREAFRWTQATGVRGLGTLGGPNPLSQAMAVSADGLVIVGWSNSARGTEAFRWTETGNMQALGFVPNSIVSYAFGVSADGGVIVGESLIAGAGAEAFRWTQASGMVSLGFLPGGTMSSARAVSADGSVVVGFAMNAASSFEAFRSDVNGMTGLGTLSGGADSIALAVNADGSVVVGRSNTGAGNTQAFYWTQTDAMRAVADILTSDGVNLGTWSLAEATGVSADGTVLVGNGFNPNGDMEGWWVRIGGSPPPPPPSPPPPPPPPPPSPPPGMLSATVLAQSLASTMGAISAVWADQNFDFLIRMTGALEVERPVRVADASRTVSDVGPGYGVSARPRVGEVRAWAAGGARSYDGDVTDSEAQESDWGLSYQATRSLRVGGALRQTSTDGDLHAYGGSVEGDSLALFGFASYQADSGLRLYAGAMASNTDSTIERGYLNGVDPVTSTGERDGRAYGGVAMAGWVLRAGDAAVMPYVRYDAVRVTLDAYDEAGGPFPASFDAVKDTLQVVRAGATANAAVSENIAFEGGIALGHRMDGRLPGVSGEVAGVTAFDLPGAEMDQDWAEANLGVQWRAGRDVNVRVSIGASTDGDTAPELSGMIGIGVRL